MKTPKGRSGGWTFLRVIGMGIAMLGMAGFGLCSVVGLFFSLSGGFVILVYAVPGAVATWLFYLLFRHITKLVNGDYRDRGG